MRLTGMGMLLALSAAGLSQTSASAHEFHLVGYGSAGGPSQPAPGTVHAVPGAAGGQAVSTFSISGSVTGLYPGRTRPLVLTVKNPQKVTIKVTSITTTVSNPSSGCAAANVKVSAFAGSLVVAAGKSATVTVQVTMAHSALNACQGAVFPFHYNGVAS
jgi:hypothetical protein